MDKVYFFIFRFPVADRSPAGLKIFEIAAGGYFPVEPLAREPYFDIIRLGGGKSKISRTQGDYAVMQAEAFQHLFSIAQEALQFFAGSFRSGRWLGTGVFSRDW